MPREITRNRASPIPGKATSRSLLPLTSYVVLLMLSTVSVVAVIVGVPNYLQSADVIRGVSMEFPNLQIIDDIDDMQAVGQLRLYNGSPLALVIEGCFFDLHLGRAKVGISSHASWGTDLELYQGPHDRTLDIYRIIEPYDYLNLDFSMYLLTDNLDFVRSQQQSGNIFWFTRAVCQVTPPYSSASIEVELAAALMEQ